MPNCSPELLEALHGEAATARHAHVVRREMPRDLPHAFDVLGVTLEVSPVLLGYPRVRRAVDVIGGACKRGDSARDEHGLEPFGRGRQVAHRAEAAIALAQDRPALVADESAADLLGVANDVVGAEMSQVLRLLLRRELAQALGRHRRGYPGAALVEEQHAVFLRHALDPA
jgi:hypothetical protein